MTNYVRTEKISKDRTHYLNDLFSWYCVITKIFLYSCLSIRIYRVTSKIFNLACERSFEEEEDHGEFWKNFFGG
jgi:hypothetical protein